MLYCEYEGDLFMDYNRIIIELLGRIKRLEEKVSSIEDCIEKLQAEESVLPEKPKFGGQKYRALTNYLKNSCAEEKKLTFKEIEGILGFNLPPCAYNNRANWANSTSISLARSWLKAGYKTVEVNLKQEYVVFEKQE